MLAVIVLPTSEFFSVDVCEVVYLGLYMIWDILWVVMGVVPVGRQMVDLDKYIKWTDIT